MKNFRRWLRGRRIGVLMGGTSAERDISLKTGCAIWQSLKRQGFHAVAIDAAKPLPASLQRHKIDCAYIALHGPGGEDGAVQGLLQWLGIPYTGSGILASALAMDKIASKRLFEAAHLPTAPWFSLQKEELPKSLPQAKRFGFPLVVKPVDQGSAIGVSIVRSANEWGPAVRSAARYGSTLLVEKFLSGPEITVGVLGKQTLPVIEIVPCDRSFYDFHAKYAPGGSRHILPASLSAAVSRRASELALAACRVLQVRAVARVDLIVDRKAGPTLLEVNTVPGMTETSLLPDAARAVGMDFDALVLKIAECSFAA
ncbi:MAG: D-alanine--D-alanine ligase [Elusimicrobiota bacterium]